MKRVVLLSNVILLALSIDYLAQNISLYVESKSNNSLKNEIFVKENELRDVEKEISLKNKELKEIEDKNKEKVGILNVWQEELKKTNS